MVQLLLFVLVLRLVASQRLSDYKDDEDLISDPGYDEDYWYTHPRYHHGRHHHRQPCRTSPCPQNQPISLRVKEETLPPVAAPPTTTSAAPTTATTSPSSVLYKSFWNQTKEFFQDLLNLLNQLENESFRFTTPSSVTQDSNEKKRHIPFEEKTTSLPIKATTQAVTKSQTIPAKTTVKPAPTSAPATKSQTIAAATTRKVDDATKSQTIQAAPKTTQTSVVTKRQTTAVPKIIQAAPTTKKQATSAAPKTVKPATIPFVPATTAVPSKTTPVVSTVVTKKPIVFSTSQATTKQSVPVSAVTKVQTVAPSTGAALIANVKSAVFTAKPPIKNQTTAVPSKTTPIVPTVVTKKPIVFSTSQATTKQSVPVSAVTKVQTVAPSTGATPIANVKSAVFTAKPPIKNQTAAVPKSTQFPIVVDTKAIILASIKKPSSPVSTVATQATTVKKVWSTAAPTATTKKPAVTPKQNATVQATTVTKKAFIPVRLAATKSQTTTARITTKAATTKKVEVVTKGQTTPAALKTTQAVTVKPTPTSASATKSQITPSATTRKVDAAKYQTVAVPKITSVTPTTSQAPSEKPVVFSIIPDFIIRGRTTVAPKTTQAPTKKPIAFPTHQIVTKTPAPIVLATTVKKAPTTQLPIVTKAQTTQAPLPSTTQVPVSKKTFPPFGSRKNSINNRPITSILTGEESSKPVTFPNLLQQVQAQSGKASPSAKDPLIVNIFEFPKIQHEKKPVTSQPPSDPNLDKIIQRVEDRAPWLSSYLRSDQQPNKNIVLERGDANHLITARGAYPKGPPLQW